MKKMLAIIVLLCSTVCLAFTFNQIPLTRPSQNKFCFDFTDTLSIDLVREINNQGSGINNAFDIDFVVMIIPSLDGRDIVEYTVDLFSKWEIGKSTQGKKGILILIAQKEQKIKIEIGYDLEGIYTDAYVGQVEREILKEFLEQAEWGIGFLATIENFLFRIYNKDLMEEARGIKSSERDFDYYSQGAGTTNVFDFSAALNSPLPDNYAELKEYFSAQSTPELVFQRYMELCAKAVKHNNDLTIFTDLSNKFWKIWRHTSGQSKAEANELSGRRYFIREKEDRAVAFFPDGNKHDQKKMHLYFFSKSEQGWQVDINTMARTLRCMGPNWWGMTDSFHSYTPIIMKEYNQIGSFFSTWDSSKAYNHLYRIAPRDEDKNKPGISVGVHWKYTDRSKLKEYDKILTVNGIKPRDGWHFDSMFDEAPAGSTFRFELIRNGRRIVVDETFLAGIDGYEAFRRCLKTPRRWIGVYLIQTLDLEWNITRKLRDQGMFNYSSLCYVLEVYPGSPADRAGLEQEDFILDYGVPDDNGEIMPYDVVDHLYELKQGESLDLTVLRDKKDVIKIKIMPEETWHKGYF